MYCIFYKNNVTKDEFVLPVQAASREAALAMAADKYPTPAYSVLTVYSAKELQDVLASASRWPGVASKVQPTLDTLMARVRVGGGLPPLTPKPTAAKVQTLAGTATDIQSLEAKIAAMKAEFERSRNARVLSSYATQVAATSSVASNKQSTPAKKLSAKTPSSLTTPSAPLNPNQGRSVVDVLRALRG